MMVRLVIFILTFFSFFNLSLVFASGDPSPLGLTIGKATIADLKAKYSVKSKGINAYSRGEMYEVDTTNIDIEGLSSATAIFDERGILTAVIMEFPKTKFGEFYYYWDKIFKSLRSKYKLVKSQVPFVGNRYAEFVSGNSKIILDAPHLSFEMTLIYARKDFWQKVKEAERMEKRKKEGSLERNL
ncbi:hypothetical protein [Thermodesulfobacterium thermophilum]|uniref:hypothetical protein n=1 Tax=Thermodesulfobacterium thermophilum TaxID=886 RepID=UPI0003B56578|nr:hypothetical protein [Thermodesulfobacterium thermophilum]